MIKTVKEFKHQFEEVGMDLEELQKAYEELNFACFRKRWKDDNEKTEMYKTLNLIKFEMECEESY